ncbi:MAG: hypothetical protein ACR2HH_09550 [Chthoniobacterales bacterium]
MRFASVSLASGLLLFCLASAHATATRYSENRGHRKAAAAHTKTRFLYQDKKTGRLTSASVVDGYARGRIVYPLAKIDPRLDKRMVRAASIAQERSHAHSKSRCWHYVKEALFASGAVKTRPVSVYAKQAGEELVRSFGFKKLAIRDPYKAPIGAVLVYGARRAPGHVEIRTKTGFVSDFRNKTPSRRPLIGIYAKI